MAQKTPPDHRPCSACETQGQKPQAISDERKAVGKDLEKDCLEIPAVVDTSDNSDSLCTSSVLEIKRLEASSCQQHWWVSPKSSACFFYVKWPQDKPNSNQYKATSNQSVSYLEKRKCHLQNALPQTCLGASGCIIFMPKLGCFDVIVLQIQWQ